MTLHMCERASCGGKKNTLEYLTVAQHKPGIREAVVFCQTCVIWEYFMLQEMGLARYLLCLSGVCVCVVLLENSLSGSNRASWLHAVNWVTAELNTSASAFSAASLLRQRRAGQKQSRPQIPNTQSSLGGQGQCDWCSEHKKWHFRSLPQTNMPSVIERLCQVSLKESHL